MVIQPITIKDRQTNTRVLNALNKNHKDDIFLCNKWKKTDTAKVNYTLSKNGANTSRLSNFNEMAFFGPTVIIRYSKSVSNFLGCKARSK